MAMMDFYADPLIGPVSDQYLKMKENNHGHPELSTCDTAGTVLEINMVFTAQKEVISIL